MAEFTLKQNTLDNSNMVEIGSPEDIIDRFKQELIDEIEKEIASSKFYDDIRMTNGMERAIEIIKNK